MSFTCAFASCLLGVSLSSAAALTQPSSSFAPFPSPPPSGIDLPMPQAIGSVPAVVAIPGGLRLAELPRRRPGGQPACPRRHVGQACVGHVRDGPGGTRRPDARCGTPATVGRDHARHLRPRACLLHVGRDAGRGTPVPDDCRGLVAHEVEHIPEWHFETKPRGTRRRRHWPSGGAGLRPFRREAGTARERSVGSVQNPCSVECVHEHQVAPRSLFPRVQEPPLVV